MKKKKLKKRLEKLEREHRALALKYYKVNEIAVSNLKDISDFKTLRENMQETINHLNKLMGDIKEKEFNNGKASNS